VSDAKVLVEQPGRDRIAKNLDATLVVEAQPEALHSVIEGAVDREEAVADGRVRILVGSQKELAELVAMFAPVVADAPAAPVDATVAAA